MILTPAQSRLLAWLVLAVVASAVLTLLAPVLTPFVVAGVLAYALHPLVAVFERYRIPRWLGSGVAICLLSLVLAVVILLIVPVVTRQLPLLRDQVPEFLVLLNGWLKPLSDRLGWHLAVDVEAVRGALRQLVTGRESELMAGLMSSLRIGGSVLAAVLGNLVLMPIVAYYLLLDWEGLVARVKVFVPPRFLGATQRFLDETDAVLGQYLRGQLIVMGILAVFYTVGLALVGLKLALPIGVFTGLAVFVPYLGFGLGMVLGLLAAALEFQSVLGVVLVGLVFGIGQVLESMWLTPRLLGERIGLHPIAVIFALLAFGHLFGFVGILVALPVSAVLLVALRRLMEAYSSSDLYAGDGLRKVAPSVPERLGADRAAPAAPAAFTAAEGPPAP
ncbi:MAG: AI-2E family transporter [Burkholderiales bacterium]|nr:AI-2E family transporter [Burkholderiales bacterium]